MPENNQQSFAQIRNNTNPRWWRDAGLRLNVFHCVILYFCVFYLGLIYTIRQILHLELISDCRYDASLLNGLQAMPQWEKFFHSPSSGYLGLISASLFLRQCFIFLCVQVTKRLI